LESQGFSWALVQEQLDLVELLLRDGGQVGASWEVLPQEQILFRDVMSCLSLAA
jgi:hypothetical protein